MDDEVTVVSAEVFDRLVRELSRPGEVVPALTAALAKSRRLVIRNEG